jgi:hypothetical protein
MCEGQRLDVLGKLAGRDVRHERGDVLGVDQASFGSGVSGRRAPMR